MNNFAVLLNAGTKAVRETSPSSKIIVHISNGYDNAMFRWMFDGLKTNKVDYDIIAMSLYPDANTWKATTDQCYNNMLDMIARYGKPIMISEVGMDVTRAAECKNFLTELIKKNKGKKIILIDRFSDSTIAYQHYGMGVNRKLIENINNHLLKDIKIDFTFLNIVNNYNMKKRLGQRKRLNRYDKFDTKFYNKVQNGFIKLSKSKPKKYIKINSNMNIKINEKIILDKIKSLI